MAETQLRYLTDGVDVPELGEHVLYVEQAMMDTITRPYRQRLYVINPGTDPTTDATSQVWEFEVPAAVVGLCDDPAAHPFDAADVSERPGCASFMTWMDDHFEGETNGRDCLSSLYDATYATSEIEVREEGMASWDRGYDDSDTQVWGAVAGLVYSLILSSKPGSAMMRLPFGPSAL